MEEDGERAEVGPPWGLLSTPEADEGEPEKNEGTKRIEESALGVNESPRFDDGPGETRLAAVADDEPPGEAGMKARGEAALPEPFSPLEVSVAGTRRVITEGR